jgi:hypothetical protein
LRLEHSGRLVTGTIPVTVSSDSRVTVAMRGRSLAARHLDLLRYRWRYGVEHLHWELAGFVPVLRRRHRAWIPTPAVEYHVDEGRLVTVHGFLGIHASGWIPAWNHCAQLASRHMPAAMKFMLRKRPLAEHGIAVQLTRSISWTMDSVSIEDRITGELGGKRLVVGTRSLNNCKIHVNGVTLGPRLQGWSSDGLQEIQLYATRCRGSECRYDISLQASRVHTG